MDYLGKWKVELVFKDLNKNSEPIYIPVSEANKLDMFQDASSKRYINSIYDFKEHGVDVIYNDIVVETLPSILENGNYYLLDEEQNKFKVVVDKDGLALFMVMLKLKKM